MTTPLSSPADHGAVEFSPAPLLDAFENFEGSFFDIERDLRTSASELKKLKTELRRKMVDAGLVPGDRIVTALPNGPLFAAVWAASLEAGGSPILVHGETPGLELERMAQRWGGRFLVAEAGTGDGREQKPAGQDETDRRRNGTGQGSSCEGSGTVVTCTTCAPATLSPTDPAALSQPSVGDRNAPCDPPPAPTVYWKSPAPRRINSAPCARPVTMRVPGSPLAPGHAKL